jgi:IS4 transposase
LFSTDPDLSPDKILLYYKQRFQIEFLFRDAKNYAGLENCQARSVNKINFHVNASLTTVSLAKALHYLSIPAAERELFHA